MKRFALGLSVLLTAVVASVIAASALAKQPPPAPGLGKPAITFVAPSPAEGATLTTNGVTFAFTYNRIPKATQTLICDLAGPTPSSGPCDTPTAFGDKHSQSGASYSALANGDYTFTVTLTLTDGGTATAVRHFTINACTAGSENFSEDAQFSQPTTFSGGTIDTAYGNGGNIRVQGSSWNGGFAAGTHVLFSGIDVRSFKLTFTQAVGSVQLEGQSDTFSPTNDTLTAYDASNNVVGSATHQDPSNSTNTFLVTSATNNIKSFTFSTDSTSFSIGVGFSNIVWGCAS